MEKNNILRMSPRSRQKHSAALESLIIKRIAGITVATFDHCRIFQLTEEEIQQRRTSRAVNAALDSDSPFLVEWGLRASQCPPPTNQGEWSGAIAEGWIMDAVGQVHHVSNGVVRTWSFLGTPAPPLSRSTLLCSAIVCRGDFGNVDATHHTHRLIHRTFVDMEGKRREGPATSFQQNCVLGRAPFDQFVARVDRSQPLIIPLKGRRRWVVVHWGLQALFLTTRDPSGDVERVPETADVWFPPRPWYWFLMTQEEWRTVSRFSKADAFMFLVMWLATVPSAQKFEFRDAPAPLPTRRRSQTRARRRLNPSRIPAV